MRSTINNQKAMQYAVQRTLTRVDVVNAGAVQFLRSVTPIRTGQLRDNWRVIPAYRIGTNRVRGGVINTTHYAWFVDKGTSKMAPRNMTRRLFDQYWSTAAARIGNPFG